MNDVEQMQSYELGLHGHTVGGKVDNCADPNVQVGIARRATTMGGARLGDLHARYKAIYWGSTAT